MFITTRISITACIGLVLVFGALVGCGGEQPAGPAAVSPASIQVSGLADTLTALGATRQLTAAVKDAGGANLSGVTVTWSSSAPSVLQVNPTSGLVTALANGAATITAQVGSVQGSLALAVAQSVATVTVTPGAPGVTRAGQTVQLAAAAKDSLGAAVAGVRFLWGSSDGSVATVDTTGLLTGRGAGQTTISASGRGIPGYSNVTVTITALQLAFSVQPTATSAGASLSPAIQVEIRDSAGTLVQNARNAVTLLIGTNPSGGNLGGSGTVNAVGGVATFSGMWIDKVGAGYTLAASASGLSSATSSAFSVAAGTPAQLAFSSAPPASVEANVTIPSVQVAVQDAYGNLVTTAGGSVILSLSHLPWSDATLGGTLTQPVSGGHASFANLVLPRPGAEYRIRASLGATTVESAPVAAHVSFTSIATGSYHSCGLATGGTFCWGQNDFGQLGTPTSTAFMDSVPRPVAGLFVELAAGTAHTCGRTAGGAVYCWGFNAQGELGDGSFTAKSSPTLVQGSVVFASIGAFDLNTCGLDGSGNAYCWGFAGSYDIGDGQNSVNRNVPTPVLGGLQFTQLSVSYNPCGLVAGGAVYCWGSNGFGEIGDSTTTVRPTPTQVAGSGTGSRIFTSITTGVGFACGINSSNLALCWGNNSTVQLGRAVGETRVPGFVQTGHLGGVTWLSIEAGDNHVCGVGTGNIGYCWGANADGQMGINNPNNGGFAGAVVSSVSGFTFSSMAGGLKHSCALDASVSASKRVICWGNDLVGQLGDGATGTRRDFGVAVVQ